MYILGLNAYHGDSSAAIIHNGIVVAAAEEERFTRQKHWAGVPLNAINFCLGYVDKKFSDLSYVAINSDSSAHFWKKFAFGLRSQPGFNLIVEKLKSRSSRENILESISRMSGHKSRGVKLKHVEHHLCHLASAFYPSEFHSSALLSVDGFGDFSSAAWGFGIENNIDTRGYSHFPHSLGIFYQAITQYLGFPNYGDEYKVMGLASYGVSDHESAMSEILHLDRDSNYLLSLPYFRHHKNTVYHRDEHGIPNFDRLYSPKLEQLLGPARNPGDPITDKHRNIAASAQAAYEQAFFALLNRLQQETNSENLSLAGGCAMNSVANGKIRQATKFRNIYVQPASGDAGGAIGAALMTWKNLGKKFTSPVMPDAYLGPKFSHSRISSVLKDNINRLQDKKFEITEWKNQALVEHIAKCIADGLVIGWFQGRMEWGPRALGNRSILADPRRADVQDLLNEKIKRRESFRPFAPSILNEFVSTWFETDDTVPYMEKVYPVRKDKQSQIPAVTHIDGSGRLQTVTEMSNLKYHRLISAFYKLTGVPILLNTSFNENEPVVCTPNEALDCFLRTRMDILVMENVSITRVMSQ